MFWKFGKISRKNACERVYWKKLHYVESRFLLNKVLHQVRFLRNSRKIHRNLQYKSGLLHVIKEGVINFKYFNFDIESYSFFIDLKLFYARKLDSELVVCMFSLTVHHSLARVQSSTCTIYRKFLLKSITTMLTPKLGICPPGYHHNGFVATHDNN